MEKTNGKWKFTGPPFTQNTNIKKKSGSTWRLRFIIKLHYIHDCPLGTVAVIDPFLHQHSNVVEAL